LPKKQETSKNNGINGNNTKAMAPPSSTHRQIKAASSSMNDGKGKTKNTEGMPAKLKPSR
jgi:hypothetical protein